MDHCYVVVLCIFSTSNRYQLSLHTMIKSNERKSTLKAFFNLLTIFWMKYLISILFKSCRIVSPRSSTSKSYLKHALLRYLCVLQRNNIFKKGNNLCVFLEETEKQYSQKREQRQPKDRGAGHPLKELE